jgi:uncharacterized protein YjbJ (UPF0337 family)
LWFGAVERLLYRQSFWQIQEVIMDKDRVVGSAKQVKGEVKQAVGKIVGDEKLVSEGKADKLEGKVQNTIGGIKDTIKDAVNEK